jgi:hypothetical protein
MVRALTAVARAATAAGGGTTGRASSRQRLRAQFAYHRARLPSDAGRKRREAVVQPRGVPWPGLVDRGSAEVAAVELAR